jgi:hypothetical protein
LTPYEPGKATGSLDPTLPMPANKDKCGGMGKIIMAVQDPRSVDVTTSKGRYENTAANGPKT